MPLYLFCQLTYNFGSVPMLPVLPLHFPYYLHKYADISKPASFSLSVPSITLLSLPTFPSQGLGILPGHSVPWLLWHYFGSQLYMHNQCPGNLFSELGSKLFFFFCLMFFFHLYALLGGCEESENKNRIEEGASKLKKNHWCVGKM